MGTIRILSRSDAMFKDRQEAGSLLARELLAYKRQKPVVLGIPRGGIVVAQEIANELNGYLDLIMARKLRAPAFTELAMGSVAEDGKVFLNEDVVRELNVTKEYIQQEKSLQMSEIKRRIELFRQSRPKVPLAGRIVIVTDDGIATGATAQAAFWGVRIEKPEKLIAALPVGPEEQVTRLAADVDEMLCLRTPPLFGAVGQFYISFEQIEDDEVVKILKSTQLKGSVK